LRLVALHVENSPPIDLFDVADLSDVVIIAGPNGVGKTRLIDATIAYLRGGSVGAQIGAMISATSLTEVNQWGKRELDLSSNEDRQRLNSTLQANRRRKNLSSSLINFESDRSIRNLQPLQFTWDFPDPDEEMVGWDSTFGYMHDRFQDTLHAIFKLIESQKQKIATRALQLRRDGHTSMNLQFPDPMEPFKEIFSLLLSPKVLLDPSARTQQLEYSLDGQTLNFNTLSSGEREVVNIAFDFLLRRPQDCIVFFDEPELHLHPELSYRLLNALRRIGSRNQLVLSTHSPDIISASLDQSVVFLAPPSRDETGCAMNQAVIASESDSTNQALRLLGQSIGVVALGKRIVLIEGTNTSLDKQTYGSMVGEGLGGLVLVPSGGRRVIESFATIYESVLNRTVWGVEFFMLCDGDSRPLPSAVVSAAEASGQLRILPRYHLENYFLDEHVWAEAFGPLESADSWLIDAAQVRGAMRDAAGEFISYAAALSASAILRMEVGNVDLMPSDVHGKNLSETQELFVARAQTELSRVTHALDSDQVRQVVAREFGRMEASLNSGDDSWKVIIPGRQILNRFCGRAGIQVSRAKNMYLAVALDGRHNTFDEVNKIFDHFRST